MLKLDECILIYQYISLIIQEYNWVTTKLKLLVAIILIAFQLLTSHSVKYII